MYRNTRDCLDGVYHVVVPGDTLYKISKFYNVSIQDLISVNSNIDPNVLRIGQRICIPVEIPLLPCSEKTTPYIIKKGDTLYSIASKFNMPINTILRFNPLLNPQKLMIGQRICIPKSWDVYSNKEYNVTFMYPAFWERVNDEKYQGKSGYFQVAAVTTNKPLNNLSKHEGFNNIRDYGQNPKFINLEIENQPATLILPSEDQDIKMKNRAALIVKYPKKTIINGTPYNYLILWVNKEYIRQIGSSLRFLVY